MNRISLRIITTFMTCILFSYNIYASDVDDLKDKQDTVKDDIEQGQDQMDEMNKSIDELNAAVQDLDKQISDKQAVIDDYNAQLIVKKTEIAGAQAELDKALKDESNYMDEMKKRIKVMYEYGNEGYIDVLFESKDIGDFFTRLEYISQIIKYDDNMVDKLQQIQSDIETKKTKLESEEENLKQLEAQANEEKSRLESLYSDKSEQMKKLQENKELLEAQIEKWQDEQDELQKLIDEAIERERERLRQQNLEFTDGQFLWPLENYHYLSSSFVNRISPITGLPEHHDGIDIPAPYGTPVMAAASGIVIAARWSNSFGNLVMIDHGSGYVTVYGHNSKLLVKEGDAVVKGENISLIGSTGWSTGNHLHFGIQLNRKYIDPMSFFNN